MNLESLRKFCLSLPGTSEDVKWGADLCFLVGDKMFAVTGFEPPHGVSFKVTEEEFEELTLRKGFSPAPYLARAKWILAEDLPVMTDKEWKHYIRQSYELIKSKLPVKVRAAIDKG